jgi:hypothetical protein
MCLRSVEITSESVRWVASILDIVTSFKPDEVLPHVFDRPVCIASNSNNISPICISGQCKRGGIVHGATTNGSRARVVDAQAFGTSRGIQAHVKFAVSLLPGCEFVPSVDLGCVAGNKKVPPGEGVVDGGRIVVHHVRILIAKLVVASINEKDRMTAACEVGGKRTATRPRSYDNVFVRLWLILGGLGQSSEAQKGSEKAHVVNFVTQGCGRCCLVNEHVRTVVAGLTELAAGRSIYIAPPFP